MKIAVLINPLKQGAQNYRIVRNLFSQMPKSVKVYYIYPVSTYKQYRNNMNFLNHFPFLFPFFDQYILFQKDYFSFLKNNNILINLVMIFYYFFNKICFFIFSIKIETLLFKIIIEKLNHKHFFDFIVGISNPFDFAFTISLLKGKFKKVLYQLDPHSAKFIKSKFFLKEQKRELLLIKKSDIIFVPPGNYEFLVNGLGQSYIKKIVKLELPIFVPQFYNFKKRASSELFLCFMGSLNFNIRNPIKVFEFFEFIKIPKLKFKLYGTGLPLKIQNELKNKFPFLFFYDYLEQDKLFSIVKKCDFLINIGNNENYHFPSKLFEYISFFKPIINFTKFKDDISVHYLHLYQNYLILFEGDSFENNEKKFNSFINSKNRNSFEIQNTIFNFQEFMPSNVSKKFIKEITK
jgi:hypothetical protein